MRLHHLLIASLFTVLISCQGGSSGGGPPSDAEAAKLTEEYLVRDKQSRCGGSVYVDEFEFGEVKSFNKRMGGYPVTARVAIRCQEGGGSSTFRTKQARTVAYIRKRGGSYETFLPKELAKAMKKLGIK